MHCQYKYVIACEEKCLHEKRQHSLVHIGVATSVENRQQDQSTTANESEGDSKSRKNLLRDVVVHCQATLVAEPALHTESGVEEHHHNRRASDEQWFAPASRAESRNVHNVLAWVIPWVARVALCSPHSKHSDESAYMLLVMYW